MIEYSEQSKTLDRPFNFTAIGDVFQEAPEFPIRGIRVDNYTDRWIYCKEVYRHIPPLALGWQALARPSLTNITLEYVNPPDGAAPRPRIGGEYALVKLFESELEHLEPVPFGLGVVTIPYAPVEALYTRQSETTSGTANTSKTSVMLAAPGVGLRYRLWGYGFSKLTTTNADFRIVLQDDLSPTFGIIADSTYEQPINSQFAAFGTHGVQLTENSALNLITWATQASRIALVTVHYSIENVD